MEYNNLSSRFADEISKTFVGSQDIVRLMLVSLLSQGHILLEGNPGLGKTTLAKAFAQTIGGEFKRIQMTPDTLPADIIGTYVYDQRTASFGLRKGPIFGNVILVDELNRATPKAQSALVESMQERQVSIDGRTNPLNEPFMVIATQVGFGGAGTYPLSEVQSDRFAFSAQVGYPTIEDEINIVSKIDTIEGRKSVRILTSEEITATIENIKEVFVSDALRRYIVSLSKFLRESDNLRIPPSTRSSIVLYKGARALAYTYGRAHAIPDDVKFLAPYVFQHRILLKPEALSEEVSREQTIAEMLNEVPVPKE